MSKASRLFNFLSQSSFVRSYSFLWVLPIFIIQLCLYLNVSDRPAEPLFFLQVALFIFFIIATILYGLLRILGLFSKNTFAWLLNIADILFVAFFILVVFFPVQQPLIDGREFPPVPVIKTIKQIATPIIVIALLFLLSRKRRNEFKSLQISVLAASVVFIVYSVISMNSVYKNKVKSTEMLCELGKRNVIFLIVETFQGNYLEELAAESPELFDSFTGMTFFSKAVTSVVWSSYSTIQLFSGGHEWSNCDGEASAISTLNKDSMLVTARNQGYRFSGGRYTPTPGYEYASVQGGDVSLATRLPSILLLHLRYYSASVRRVIPAFTWHWLRRVGNKAHTRHAHIGLYPDKVASKNNFVSLTQCLHAGEANAFLYFFNYMTHFEIVFDRHGNSVHNQPQNKYTQLEEYRYALSLYADFLNKLKSIGVYDDSLIIIVGDHGSYNEPMRTYNPAIFIKPPQATGKLAVSHANVLHTDIRPLVEAYMRDGDDAFRTQFTRLLQETGPREISVYTRPGQEQDAWSGRNYHHRKIFGDIETIIRNDK